MKFMSILKAVGGFFKTIGSKIVTGAKFVAGLFTKIPTKAIVAVGAAGTAVVAGVAIYKGIKALVKKLKNRKPKTLIERSLFNGETNDVIDAEYSEVVENIAENIGSKKKRKGRQMIKKADDVLDSLTGINDTYDNDRRRSQREYEEAKRAMEEISRKRKERVRRENCIA